MVLRNLRILTSFAIGLLISINSIAENNSDKHRRAMIAKDAREASCFYRTYPAPFVTEDKCEGIRPEGYEAFYVSHYGRHGSRWISKNKIYKRIEKELSEAKRLDGLTNKGKELYELAMIAIEDARGRAGELTPIGALEHRGIAERMYWRYPEIFRQDHTTNNKEGVKIDSRSTMYTRCVYSMIAFDERLKEINPNLKIWRESSRRNLGYMSNYSCTPDSLYKAASKVADSTIRQDIPTKRFLRRIYKKGFIKSNIEDPTTSCFDLFNLACNVQNTGLRDVAGDEIDLFRFFTTGELYKYWKAFNESVYIKKGPSERFGERVVANAVPLLRNIVATADTVILEDRQIAATLRFGHESNLLPLLSLMGVDDSDWSVSELTPMAANLQFIFFRPQHQNDIQEYHVAENEDIKVRILHNEKDIKIQHLHGPFYNWQELRNYFLQQLTKFSVF